MRLPDVPTPESCWQRARDWLWRQRQNAPANADVWDLRWRWLTGNEGEGHSLRAVSEALSSGRYAFVHRTDIRGYYGHIQTVLMFR